MWASSSFPYFTISTHLSCFTVSLFFQSCFTQFIFFFYHKWVKDTPGVLVIMLYPEPRITGNHINAANSLNPGHQNVLSLSLHNHIHHILIKFWYICEIFPQLKAHFDEGCYTVSATAAVLCLWPVVTIIEGDNITHSIPISALSKPAEQIAFQLIPP